MDENLLSVWRGCAGRIGAQHDVDAEGSRLLAAYDSPSRRYHDRAHLHAVLTAVDTLAVYATDPDVVRVAAWFHDAVYDVSRTDNEVASAALAETVLDRLDVSPDIVAEVTRLVRLTATHDPGTDDRDGQVLCDADLSILGAGADTYVGYAAAIRLEYLHVPDRDFAIGRAAVLRSLLERPRLYRTPAARLSWEDRARLNVGRELAFLDASAAAAPPPEDG